MALNPRQRRFAEELVTGKSATQAYIAAGYSPQGAGQSAEKLLKNAEISAYVSELQAEIASASGITVRAVLERFWRIATADPNELVEHRRTCCRCCYGQSFGFQYTAKEMAAARSKWSKKKDRADGEVFDIKGGVGFDARKIPNPNCPECYGDGESYVFAKDTRRLSPAASVLYAGARSTRDGVEIKMHNQQAALEVVAKHLGMLVEHVQITDWSALSDDELVQLEQGKTPPRLKIA